MFDFLFQNKKGELHSYSDIVSVDITRVALSKIAIEKAVTMIAKAVSKSEFVVERNNERVKDHVYWTLNVMPNPNETATDFWIDAVRRMLMEQECLIVNLQGNIYIANNFSVDDVVMIPQTYKDVSIESNGNTYNLKRVFQSGEVMHLKNRNGKIHDYITESMALYDKIISSLIASKKIASAPKFTLDIDTQIPVVRQKDASGVDKVLTIDQYKKQLKAMLESENIEILTNSGAMKVNQLQITSNSTSEDIAKLTHEVNTECAFAFDIPKPVFLGEITEKADSTNEFITYAVSWVVETINDSMNAKLVGEEAYLKGEKIWIDMSKYKHVDLIESAANLDKLRSIGFTFDEIREMVGWEALHTEFSQQRVITKNYTNELGGDGNATNTGS